MRTDENIHDRSRWPSADTNPSRVMLRRGEEWCPDRKLVAALGLAPPRALIRKTATRFVKDILPGDTAISGKMGFVISKHVSVAHGGSERYFGRRAVVLAAMRTKSVNAAALPDWVATQMAEATMAF